MSVTELKPSAKAEAPPATKQAGVSPAKPAKPAKPSITGPSHDIPQSVDPLLTAILSWPRSHGSMAELAFCEWLTSTLTDLGHAVVKWEEGSMFVDVPHKNGKKASTLFSCHVDTVDGPMKTTPSTARKSLVYDANFGHITLDKDSIGNCLGADDGAGVWVMLNMLAENVPGGYLFHRGEECGGVSAKANAMKRADQLKRFDVAVAFDRPRTDEIITHQGGMECASNKFATALCAELNAHGFDYKPSNRGVYTDTKEYRRIVAECINVGVGYEQQHGRDEFLDYAHLKALTEACIKLDWESLPVDRDPAKAYGYNGFPGYAGYGTQTEFDDVWETPAVTQKPAGKSTAKAPEPTTLTPLQEVEIMLDQGGVPEVAWFIENNPADAVVAVVALLRERARLKADVATLEAMVGMDYIQ